MVTRVSSKVALLSCYRDCINRIGQDKLDEALRLIDHFEMEEFDVRKYHFSY